MAIKDLLGRFTSLQINVGDAVWKEQNARNRKASKLSGAESRLMRNAQSRIRKDIKAAEKALKRGENVSSYLETLKSLQRHMRQSNVIDGTRVYNNRSERRDALNRYLSDFAGMGRREHYKTHAVDYVPRDNPMYQHMQVYFDELETKKNELNVFYPSVEDMESELYEMVRKYDYNKAIDIINRMRNLMNDITNQRGSTDYDAF